MKLPDSDEDWGSALVMVQAIKGLKPKACFALKMLWSCFESVIQPLNSMVVINKCVLMFLGGFMDQKMLDGHSTFYRSFRKH